MTREQAQPGARVSIVDLTDPRNLCSDNLLGTIQEVSGLKAFVVWDEERGHTCNRPMCSVCRGVRWYHIRDLWPVGD